MAIDQGTTSSRAIVFAHDGTILAAAQEPFTQHYPAARLGGARPGGYLGHAAPLLPAGPRALGPAARPTWRPSASPTSGRPSCSGTRRPAPPLGNAIVWQCRRTAERCAALEAAGMAGRVTALTGLRLDPYFSATKLEWLLANRPGAARSAAPRAAARRHHRQLPGLAAHRRPRPRDRLQQRLAHHAARSAAAGVGGRDAASCSACRARCSPSSAPPRAWSAPPTRRCSARPCPSPASPATSRRRCSDRAGSRPGDSKNTYGTGCFLLVNTGRRGRRARGGLLSTVPGCWWAPRAGEAGAAARRRAAQRRAPAPAGRCATPWRARSSRPGRRCSGCATGWAHERRGRDRAAGGPGARQRRRLLRAGAHRARRPLLGPERPGDCSSGSPGAPPGSTSPGRPRRPSASRRRRCWRPWAARPA